MRFPWARTLFEARGVPKDITKLETQTSTPDIWSDQKKANALFRELKGLRSMWDPVTKLQGSLKDLLELTAAASPEDTASLEREYERSLAEWASLEVKLYLGGEFDHQSAYLTIASGAGGTEAQDWAGMLVRMYLRYCEAQGWKTELMEKTDGQEAGIKTATFLVEGDPAFGYLKCERGVHRLVRLSPFNAKNLRQTSFALVEVLPELPENCEVQIASNELKIDTYRSGGAGGQNVNKVESAVRITHIPSGIVVACQTERSQLQNRERAMHLLQAKLMEKQRQEDLAKKSELKGAKESADFGQQIRSYVLHPYQMVKDLRTDHETSNTQAVLDGDLQGFIDAELKRMASTSSTS